MIVNGVLLTIIIGITLFLAFSFWRQRRWTGMVLALSFLLRILVAAILSGGLQYVFVLDSLEYEMKAWYLAQSWMNESLVVGFNNGQVNNYNLYDYFLSAFFWLFGKTTFLAPVANCAMTTLTILLLCRMRAQFFKSENKELVVNSTMMIALLAAVYPSYLVFSATNIRDPLYLLSTISFIYFFLLTFSMSQNAGVGRRFYYFAICGLSLALTLGLRGYIVGLLVGSLAFGVFTFSLTRVMSFRKTSAVLAGLAIIMIALTQIIFPEQVATAVQHLVHIRHSFANYGFVEIYAQSSFAINQDLAGLSDVFLFLPNALIHYFFAPFPWEIVNLVQTLSFAEALMIILLAYPTIIGIRRTYDRAPFVTVVLCCVVFTFAIAQSLAISNMGTIFRHRTLCILLSLVFTSEGLYVVIKKNYPTLLAS